MSRAKTVGDVGERARVAVLLGELDHRGRAQTAVEVVVQQHLRRRDEDVAIDPRHADTAVRWRLRNGIDAGRWSQFQAGYSASPEMQCSE